MNEINRREILLGTTALITAGLLPSIPRTPITPQIQLMQESLAADIEKPDYMVRLHANENPYGPSRAALQAISANISQTNRYRRGPVALRSLLAEINGVSADSVVVGTGSNEILRVAGMLASIEDGLQGGSIVTLAPTYQALLRYAENAGVEIIRVPVNEDLNVDLEAMRKAVRSDTKLIYLVNPNNPIPSVIEKNALREFVLEMAEDRLVFIDEAYHEYAQSSDYQSMMELIAQGKKNIIISRTASKVHGLAGMRIGFGFAEPELARKMRQRKTGETHVLAVEAAHASYLDEDFQAFSLAKNRECQLMVESLCKELGLRSVKSNTNFAFIQTGHSNRLIQDQMKQFGILTGRDFRPFEDSWSRVSMAKPEEVKYFTQAFRKVFKDVLS